MWALPLLGMVSQSPGVWQLSGHLESWQTRGFWSSIDMSSNAASALLNSDARKKSFTFLSFLSCLICKTGLSKPTLTQLVRGLSSQVFIPHTEPGCYSELLWAIPYSEWRFLRHARGQTQTPQSFPANFNTNISFVVILFCIQKWFLKIIFIKRTTRYKAQQNLGWEGHKQEKVQTCA